MTISGEAITPIVKNWEEAVQATPGAAAAGVDAERNGFGLHQPAAVRVGWTAGPLLTARWAWNDARGKASAATPRPEAAHPLLGQYAAGQPLGDLPVAAQGRLGQGRVVAIGDDAMLTNDGIPWSHVFVARLLGWLASPSGSPQDAWRQALGLLAAIALIGLLAWRPDALQVFVAAGTMAISLAYCDGVGAWAPILPDGRSHCAQSLGLHRRFACGGVQPRPLERGRPGRVAADAAARGLLAAAPRRGRRRTPGSRRLAHFDRPGASVFEQRVRGRGEFCPPRRNAHQHGRGGVDRGEPRPAGRIRPLRAARPHAPLGQEPRDGAAGLLLADATWNTAIARRTCNSTPAGRSGAPTSNRWSSGPAENSAVPKKATNTRSSSRSETAAGQVVLIGDSGFAMNKNMGFELGDVPENLAFWQWLLSPAAQQEDWVPPNQGPTDEPAENKMIGAEKAELLKSGSSH